MGDRPVAARKHFVDFQDLMRHRVLNIILVAPPYDAYVLEEAGELSERMLGEFRNLDLHYAPALTSVATGAEALEFAKSRRGLNLILATPRLADMHAGELARRVQEEGIDAPVILFGRDLRELADFETRYGMAGIERAFVWQGDARILIAILKSVEDRRNAEHDAGTIGVQVILLVEDGVRQYSSFLPAMYGELLRHSQRVVATPSTAAGTSRWPTAARCCWTRSGRCRCTSRANSCAPSRSARSPRSGRTGPWTSTSGSSPRPTRICRPRSSARRSAATSSTASPSCPCACRRFASGPRTSPCWSSTSSRGPAGGSSGRCGASRPRACRRCSAIPGPATCASSRTSSSARSSSPRRDVLTGLERFLGGPAGAQAPVDLSLPFRDAKARIVEEFERAYVAGLLDAHGGKLTAAAKHADMDPKNFSDKMARYGLRRQAAESGDGGTRAT